MEREGGRGEGGAGRRDREGERGGREGEGEGGREGGREVDR